VIRFAVLVAIVACGKGNREMHHRHCDTIVQDIAAHTVPPEQKERAGMLIARALVPVCDDDNWSDELLDCYALANTTEQFSACDAKLSPKQLAHVSAAIAEGMANATPNASTPCARFADLEIACDAGSAADRTTLVELCLSVRAKATEPRAEAARARAEKTIACAQTTTDCATFKQCRPPQ
jgi:hypothetical protein